MITLYRFYEDWSSETFRKKSQRRRLFVTPIHTSKENIIPEISGAGCIASAGTLMLRQPLCPPHLHLPGKSKTGNLLSYF
jgi:hypothetical protein